MVDLPIRTEARRPEAWFTAQLKPFAKSAATGSTTRFPVERMLAEDEATMSSARILIFPEEVTSLGLSAPSFPLPRFTEPRSALKNVSPAKLPTDALPMAMAGWPVLV